MPCASQHGRPSANGSRCPSLTHFSKSLVVWPREESLNEAQSETDGSAQIPSQFATLNVRSRNSGLPTLSSSRGSPSELPVCQGVCCDMEPEFGDQGAGKPPIAKRRVARSTLLPLSPVAPALGLTGMMADLLPLLAEHGRCVLLRSPWSLERPGALLSMHLQRRAPLGWRRQWKARPRGCFCTSAG